MFSFSFFKVGGLYGIDFHRQLQPAWNESYGKYITDVLTDEAVKLIRNHGSKSGMFMYLAHAAPHTGNPGDTLLVEPPIGRGLGQRGQNIKDLKRRVYAGD